MPASSPYSRKVEPEDEFAAVPYPQDFPVFDDTSKPLRDPKDVIAPAWEPSTTPVVPAPLDEQKSWCVLLYIASILLSIFAPLFAYLFGKERGDFIRHHTLESLNFQITQLIIAAVLSATYYGLYALPVWCVTLVVLQTWAAFRASKGEMYTFPLTWRPVRN